jgi:hypothetical protein
MLKTLLVSVAAAVTLGAMHRHMQTTTIIIIGYATR